MRKSLLKTFALFAMVLLVFFVSCGDDTKTTGGKITYELNGGEFTAEVATEYDGKSTFALPTAAQVKNGEKVFAGWYTTADFSGKAESYIKKDTSGDQKFYAKWTDGSGSGGGETTGEYKPRETLNKNGYQLGGITVLIQVNPIQSYDASRTDYTGERKQDHVTHMALINKAYNVKLQYWNWEADWGPSRIQHIRDNYMDNTFFSDKSKLTYIITISGQWIPTLVKAKTLAPLYNMDTGDGIFTELGYEQAEAINQVMAVKNVVYGYNAGAARPDHFMYYNIKKVQDFGLEDPAELWLSGQWTWSKFLEWTKKGQAACGEGEYALDLSYAPAALGFVAAQGYYFVNPLNHKIQFTNNNVTKIVDNMLALYEPYWDHGHGVQDASKNFSAGKTLLHDGSIWYVKDPTRFGQDDSTVSVGVVPYPPKDGDAIKVHTAPYTYTDTQGNKVKVEEPLLKRDKSGPILTASGEKVYGLDLSEADFGIPFTGTDAYSILDYDQKGVYGIDQKVAMALLLDLDYNFGPDPTKLAQTNDEAYRATLEKKFDDTIDLDVIMSVQYDDVTYFELMEILSMTTGDGSHYGEFGIWPVMSGIISSGVTSCYAKFSEILAPYEEALKLCGY